VRKIEISGMRYISKAVTNHLTPWSKVLLNKLTVTFLVEKFPVFYDTITVRHIAYDVFISSK